MKLKGKKKKKISSQSIESFFDSNYQSLELIKSNIKMVVKWKTVGKFKVKSLRKKRKRRFWKKRKLKRDEKAKQRDLSFLAPFSFSLSLLLSSSLFSLLLSFFSSFPFLFFLSFLFSFLLSFLLLSFLFLLLTSQHEQHPQPPHWSSQIRHVRLRPLVLVMRVLLDVECHADHDVPADGNRHANIDRARGHGSLSRLLGRRLGGV